MRIKTYILAAGVVTMMASPAFAAEDLLPPGDGPFSITGSLALTSEYFFRGLSQSDDKPAVQGGLTAGYKFSDTLAASAGVWASNVDFAPDARIEIDYTAGLSGTVMGATWNFGGIYYSYPGSENGGDPNENFDWWELTGGLGYDFGMFSLGGQLSWTPAFQAGAGQTDDSGSGYYANVNVKVPVKYVDLVGAIGRQHIEHGVRFLGIDEDNYWDYKLGVQAMVYGLTLEAAWIDTSLNDSRVTSAADNQFVFTVTKSF